MSLTFNIFAVRLLSVMGLSFGAKVAAENSELSTQFTREIVPIFVNYCYDCHGDGLKEGSLALDDYESIPEMIADRGQWQKIRDHIDFRLMPPPDEFAPDEEERAKLVRWIDDAVFAVDPENPDPGHVTLRRLNRAEYTNTIRDLLGVKIDVTGLLPVDDSGYGFDNNGDVLTLSPLHMERYLEAARVALAETSKNKDWKNYLSKSDESSDDDHMLRVVRGFAGKAFRRPLREGEAERYLDFLERAKDSGGGVDYAIKQAMSAILVSPSFLYREEPSFKSGKDSIALLDEHALASRLSYFLWSSMPDKRLRELADRGELRKNLHAEIGRMLASGKSRALVENFVGQWLQLRDMEAISPDRKTFKTFDSKLASNMRTETEMLVQYIIKENQTIMTLLDADFTFVNQRLAEHYGIEGVEGEHFRKVSLDGLPRRGLLGHGSVLTLTSHAGRTSPVLRGKYVLENILNTPPPPAPPNVPALGSESEGRKHAVSLRKELEAHRNDPACASCHALMDPIGFGLENFDGVGRWREKDRGMPIDSSGKLVTGQKFLDSEEMCEIIVRDYESEFHRSVAVKMLTYSLGRGVEYFDRPAIDEIVMKAEQDDGRFLSWVIAVAESVPFQYRRN